jgi:hypothetical protein
MFDVGYTGERRGKGKRELIVSSFVVVFLRWSSVLCASVVVERRENVVTIHCLCARQFFCAQTV